MTLNFAVLAGSRSESTSEKGAAHLLSVAGFAGTGKRSGLRLLRDLENVGATVGTSVDREKITYKVTVLPEHAEAALAAVSEAISSPPTAAYVIEDQKETAELAIAAHKSNPKSRVLELLYEAAYGENTPLGSPVFADDLSDLSVASTLGFRKSNFTASRLVVSATGLSIDTLKTMAELYLHALPAGSSALLAPQSPYVGGDVKLRDKSVGASHLAVGFPVPAGAGSEAYTVLGALLASKVSALPVPKNSVSVFLEGGLLGFYAKGDAASASGYLEAAVAELKAAASSSNSDAAKTKAALDAFLELESGSTAAAKLVGAVTSGISPVADARKVSASAVSAAAKAALGATPAYAVFGTTFGTPSYASVVKALK